MNAAGQTSAVAELLQSSKNRKHSILLEGGQGVGKTYLAKQYANMLDIPDFQIIQPKVQEIRETVEECSILRTPVVLCIENLDLGTQAASYSLLKFLEEPSENAYIVVTCRDIKGVPNTIVSRSEVITVSPSTDSDIEEFAKSVDESQYLYLKSKSIWKCAKTFSDVKIILELSPSELEYYDKLGDIVQSKDSITNKAWKLQKYEDGKDTPITLVIRYLMALYYGTPIWHAGYSCLQDLNTNRLSVNAVLSKFLMECKYTAS